MAKQYFQRSTPESCGVSSADVIALIDALCDHPEGQETHSFMLVRHGKALCEGYFSPFTADDAHTVYSITKAFTGMAVGFLEAEGRLGLSDRIADHFPGYQIHPTLSGLRIEHLMMMGTGQVGSSVVHDTVSGVNPDIADFFMTPADIPHGSEFRYQNRSSYVLAALAEKLAGMSLMDYLDGKVFSPMGIERPYAVRDGSGQYLGYSGMRLRLRELAAVGQMLMDHGVWQGKRILPEGWADRQIARHIGRDEPGLGDWSQGYCYQLWRGRHDTSRLCGAFGQMCVIAPEKDMLFVTNSGYDSDIQFILDRFYGHILTKCSDGALPEDPAALGALERKLEGLELHQLYSSPSPLLGSMLGKEIGISGSGASVTLSDDGTALSVRIVRPGKKDIAFRAGYRGMEKTPADGGDVIPYEFGDKGDWQAAACWKTQSRLSVTARLVPTQVVLTLDVYPSGGGFAADCSIRRGNPL
ncbi:MAG: beta-lactamase family protein [Clostridiales bacterium]|nr:beta-lactamase family protein [Clostridiales bacterium]